MAYLLLRNDIGWKMLSEQERASIIKANMDCNVNRDDYANPEKYGAERLIGGENWDNFQTWPDDVRSQALLKMLNDNRPARVLEIGPGAGFYTRGLCEHAAVKEYTAVDIGGAFLDFLRPRLETIKKRKNFNYNLITGEITGVNIPEKFDLIVLLSTVHHIPNRIDLFKKLSDMLVDGGTIYCFDPSHYLPRIAGLLKKCVFNGYLKKECRLNNISTHHMCSLGEYKHIIGAVGDLKIEKVFYKFPERIRQFGKFLYPAILFSNEIGVVLRKTP